MSFIRRYARFMAFLAVFAIATALLSLRFTFVTALLAGFDLGALVFIGALIRTLGDDKVEDMQQRAAENEPDQHILSLLGALVFIVVMAAVGHELANSHARDLALSGATLMLAWAFGNMLFALHYAHAYYIDDGKGEGKAAGGLDFPGDAPPLYWDFAYFAFVLGMTFQVSDVEITASKLRRVALIHSMLAFLFNIGVIALTVSLIGDMLH